MDKRLAKRHKRQVARKKEHIKLSEPDVRTQEQIEAARELSRGENIPPERKWSHSDYWIDIAAGALVTEPIVRYRDCAAAVKPAGSRRLIWKYQDSSVGAEPE
jgi:hypothetical protein